MTVARASQVVTEALSQVDPKARTSQLAVEALSTTSPKARLTQLAVELLSSNDNVAAGQPVMFILT